MKTQSIIQTANFPASPEKVYQLLTNQDMYEEFTGSEVTLDLSVPGLFEVFDGYIQGYNLELIQGKKIVQAWHFAEDGWPDDHYSNCTFLFEKDGEGTLLHFGQTGVPEHKVKALSDGWKAYYWEPMLELLASRNAAN